MGYILKEDGGEIKFINTNPLEIIDELKKSMNGNKIGLTGKMTEILIWGQLTVVLFINFILQV